MHIDILKTIELSKNIYCWEPGFSLVKIERKYKFIIGKGKKEL